MNSFIKGLKLICAQSFRTSLQFSCVKLLSQTFHHHNNKIRSRGLGPLDLPPGLQRVVENNYWFFLGNSNSSEEGGEYTTGQQQQEQHISYDLDISLAEEDWEEEWEGEDGGGASRQGLPSPRRIRGASSLSNSLTTSAVTSSGSPATKRRAAVISTARVASKSSLSASAVMYKDVSSSSEEEEEEDAVFCPSPTNKKKQQQEKLRLRSGHQRESSCRRHPIEGAVGSSSRNSSNSPAAVCSSQDLHYFGSTTPDGRPATPNNSVSCGSHRTASKAETTTVFLTPLRPRIVGGSEAAKGARPAVGSAGATTRKRFLLKRDTQS